ncbi:VOC family protein [Amnibacterium sp. CER49]|uniref:VOC family protein n=1 Tax=Amnibacterium sp. CER49 TaxID=3039161 RepID=UPI002449154B|nr:VOC family protein [Amnibacterium sp. CER49]MDH2444755.1 VOC family protein [Amnibacterium sp. CER49]
MALTVGAVVLRVTDLEREVAFWAAALDYVPRAEPEDDWVSLRPREGGGVNLSFDRKRSQYDLPPRFHLDLYADDQAAEVERLIALGAREIDVPQRPADADWRLLEDPEGNRFDVVQLSRDDQRPGS